VEARAPGTVTQAGTAIGTPAYMAPEQITGDAGIDHRADLYSFGCLAYELLAGAAPFSGLQSRELFAAHLSQTPDQVSERNPEVPPALAAVVMRCLEKDPAARPRDAREILVSLESSTTPASGLTRFRQRMSRRQRWAALVVTAVACAGLFVLWPRTDTRQVPVRRATVAIVPFVNLGGDSADEYLADGLAEGVTTALGKIPGIRVVSRTLSYQYRGMRFLDAREVGAALAANHLVQGTVQRAGGRLRVSAYLTSASDNAELWADNFDAPAADAFAVQDSITRRIASALGARLAGNALPRSGALDASSGTSNPEAYDLYLRGRFLLQRRGRGVRQAVENFEQAIARDSSFARAHASYALAIELLPYFEPLDADSVGRLAMAAARRALAADSTLPDAHTALGLAHSHRYEWQLAETSYRHAIAAEPPDADAHIQYGRFLFYTRTVREALPVFERARALDPTSAVASGWVGHLLDLSGRHDEAMAELRRALEIDSTSAPSLYMMAEAHLYAGRKDSARIYAERILRAVPAWRIPVMSLLAMLGDSEAARAALRETENQSGNAGIHAALGDSIGLFEALERATERREIWPTFSSLSERWFDFVRGSARFAAIVRSVGLDERIFTSPTGGRPR
jgi:serine/threonine-protein kinase